MVDIEDKFPGVLLANVVCVYTDHNYTKTTMPTQTDEQAIAEQAVAKMEAEHASFSAAHLAVTRMQLEQIDRTGCYREWYLVRPSLGEDEGTKAHRNGHLSEERIG